MKPKNKIKELSKQLGEKQDNSLLTFDQFLNYSADKPDSIFRNIFQLFYDFIHEYISEGADEYPDDPESIGFIDYDCSQLLVNDADNPFFADRLFANKLVGLKSSFRRGAQQNKIYVP